MATYNPPTQNLSIFNDSVFTESNPTGNLTRAQADLLYLHFPFGQGAETIPSVSITGTSLLSGTVSANNNLLLGGVNGVNYLQFPNGTKQYEAALDYPTINNVWTGKNQFNGDVSLNSTAITINGVGLKINDLSYSATPLTNVLYIDSVTNQIIKSIAKNPEVNFNLNSETITLTSETGYSGVFNITSEAVFNSTLSTCPDYSIFSLSNSFTSTSTITINKPIYVRGNGYKIDATAITTNILSITSDNVVINNIILENSNASSNAGVIAVSNSISSKIVISNSTLNTNEFAITGTWNNLFVLNNAFTFVGTTDSHRYIYPSSITGVCIINNNSFTGTSTNTRVVQLNSQSTYTGKMVFSNNTVTNSVSQVFESNGQVFTGMNFELYFVNNTTTCSNGNVIFTTTGAGIKGIYAYNNTTSMVSANTSKGLIAFSIGAAQIDPSINFYMDNNTVNGALRVDYSDVSVLQNKSITSASVPYSYPLIASDAKINFYINSNTIVNDYFYSNNVNIQKLTTNNDVFMNNLVDDNTKTKILYYDNTTSKIFKGSLPASTLLSSDNVWSGKQQFNADVSLNSITSLTSDIFATALVSTADANAVSYNTSTKKLGYVAIPALLSSDNTWAGKQQFSADVSLNSVVTVTGATTFKSTIDISNNPIYFGGGAHMVWSTAIPATAPNRLQFFTSTATGNGTIMTLSTDATRVGINSFDPSVTLDVGGDIKSSSLGTGAVYSNSGVLSNSGPSDPSLKKNIISLNDSSKSICEIVSKLNPISFEWIDPSMGTGTKYGFSALQIKDLIPDIASTFKDTKGNIKHGYDPVSLIPFLITALQQQQKKITDLEDSVSMLLSKM